MSESNLKKPAASKDSLTATSMCSSRQLPSLIPNNSDGSPRVVKKIMFIDPEKLQKAGLDKKIAEAFNKIKKNRKVADTSMQLMKANFSQASMNQVGKAQSSQINSAKPQSCSTASVVHNRGTTEKTVQYSSQLLQKEVSKALPTALLYRLAHNAQIKKPSSVPVEKSASVIEVESHETAIKTPTVHSVSRSETDDLSGTLIFNIVKHNIDSRTVEVKIIKNKLSQVSQSVVPKATLDPKKKSDGHQSSTKIASPSELVFKQLSDLNKTLVIENEKLSDEKKFQFNPGQQSSITTKTVGPSELVSTQLSDLNKTLVIENEKRLEGEELQYNSDQQYSSTTRILSPSELVSTQLSHLNKTLVIENEKLSDEKKFQFNPGQQSSITTKTVGPSELVSTPLSDLNKTLLIENEKHLEEEELQLNTDQQYSSTTSILSPSELVSTQLSDWNKTLVIENEKLPDEKKIQFNSPGSDDFIHIVRPTKTYERKVSKINKNCLRTSSSIAVNNSLSCDGNKEKLFSIFSETSPIDCLPISGSLSAVGVNVTLSANSELDKYSKKPEEEISHNFESFADEALIRKFHAMASPMLPDLRLETDNNTPNNVTEAHDSLILAETQSASKEDSVSANLPNNISQPNLEREHVSSECNQLLLCETGEKQDISVTEIQGNVASLINFTIPQSTNHNSNNHTKNESANVCNKHQKTNFALEDKSVSRRSVGRLKKGTVNLVQRKLKQNKVPKAFTDDLKLTNVSQFAKQISNECEKEKDSSNDNPTLSFNKKSIIQENNTMDVNQTIEIKTDDVTATGIIFESERTQEHKLNNANSKIDDNKKTQDSPIEVHQNNNEEYKIKLESETTIQSELDQTEVNTSKQHEKTTKVSIDQRVQDTDVKVGQSESKKETLPTSKIVQREKYFLNQPSMQNTHIDYISERIPLKELPKRKRKYIKKENSNKKANAKIKIKKYTPSSPVSSSGGESGDFFGFEEESSVNFPKTFRMLSNGEQPTTFTENKATSLSSFKEIGAYGTSTIIHSEVKDVSTTISPKDSSATEDLKKTPVRNGRSRSQKSILLKETDVINSSARPENSGVSLKKRWEAIHQKDLKLEPEESKSEGDEVIETTDIETIKQRISKRGRKKAGQKNEIVVTESIKLKTNHLIREAESRENDVDLSLAMPSHNKSFRNDVEFNGRLLLVRNRSQLDSGEPLTDETAHENRSNSDNLQCGLCLGFTSKQKWLKHISDHYGIGWVAGQQPALNINSRSAVLSTMICFFKKSKMKGLNCRMCQRLYRSALGLLLHIEICGISVNEKVLSRVKCHLCQNQYGKNAFPVHLRICKIKKQQNPEKTDDEKQLKILNNVGRTKRVSVIKAEKKLKSLEDSYDDADRKNSTSFNPADYIKYILPLPPVEDIKTRWSEEIDKFGKAFCIEKACRFTALSINTMLEHISDCAIISPSGYHCTKCNQFFSDIEEKVIRHVRKRHEPKNVESKNFDPKCEINSGDENDPSSNESVSDDEDEINTLTLSSVVKKKKSATNSSTTQPSSYAKYTNLYPSRTTNYVNFCQSGMRFFIERFYSASTLFSYAIPTFHLLSDNALNQYTAKRSVSMNFCYSQKKILNTVLSIPNTGIDWAQLPIFDKKREKSEELLYVGGPITTLAWVPLPKESNRGSSQYLAIAYRKSIDKFTRVLNQKPVPTLVLIYKCDAESIMKREDQRIGDILYGITIDDGPIHHLEFMQSGGYDIEMNRLGLLAVGTAKTEVKIYSLPLNITKGNDSKVTIVKLPPAFVLCLDLSESRDVSSVYDSQCTHLVWSQASGHTHIFGAYYNGFISIWDISEDTGNFNQFIVNDIRHYVPVNYFFCRDKEPTSLNIHYDTKGARWLCVTTAARKVVFYDISDLTKPYILREDTTKNYINALDWPVIWQNPTYALGDIMTTFGSCLITVSPMSIVYSSCKSDQSLCGINDLHYNPWNNVYVYGSENGDLAFIAMREINLLVRSKNPYENKALSVLDIRRLDGNPIPKRADKVSSEDWKMFESDYDEKYGLVFGPAMKLDQATHSFSLSSSRLPPVNLIRYMRINKVRFNPNENANSLLAVGYENGFVRIMKFKRELYFSKKHAK